MLPESFTSALQPSAWGFDEYLRFKGSGKYWNTQKEAKSYTVNGKEYVTNDTTSVINSWSDCNVGHTFAIPAMNIYVPVASPNAKLSANNLCGTSPCTTSGNPYAQETFSFMSPKATGTYRWQCFVPCGGGYLDGNSGPMQTLGWMMGEMDVVSA